MTSEPTLPRYAPVTTLMLYLTEDCNLRCTYCFVDKKPRRMTLETAKKTVDWFLSRNISGFEKTLSINFFGGEPFIEVDLMEEIIHYARQGRPNVDKRIQFSATTNGTIATPRVLKLIASHHMDLLVSLDGDAKANIERPFVNGRPSWSVVAENIPKLVAAASHTYGRITFHPGNLDLIENVTELLKPGVEAVAMCPVQEAPWHKHQEALEAAYQALAEWYIAQTQSGSIPPLIVTNNLLQHLHGTRQSRATRPCRPCEVGSTLLSVDPDGNVMPCHRFLYRPQDWLGTVETPQLSPKRDAYLKLNSRNLLGCRECVAEPVCGGGCRVVALLAGQDLQQGVHPGYCITMRAHARAALRIYEALIQENRLFSTSLRLNRLTPVQSAPLRELTLR